LPSDDRRRGTSTPEGTGLQGLKSTIFLTVVEDRGEKREKPTHQSGWAFSLPNDMGYQFGIDLLVVFKDNSQIDNFNTI